MRDISEIERLIIEYSSISLSLLVFGTLNEFYLKPVEVSLSSTYHKIKSFYGTYIKRDASSGN
jgi:hypothetical protein